VKLLPTPEQHKSLELTLQQTNAASQYVSDYAWNTHTWRQYDLHKALYYELKERFDLTAQVVVRLLAKVADAYKLDHKHKRTFKPIGAMAYDDRILHWYVDKSEVSIWTASGRARIPFVRGERQRALLASRQGESDLILFRGNFYLSATCEVQEPDPIDIEGALGVDLGIVNIAVDSDGEVHSSSQVNNVRHRHRRLRAKLQRKGTKSSRRRLHKLAGKEARFAKWVNHGISKHLVAKAVDTKRAIAIEELGGISQRVTVRKSRRATLHSWSFAQLRGFIEYKAKLRGIPVFTVDPRNTSRTCPACGHIAKANRRNQSTFLCVVCGFSGLADHIAAGNIASRAAVNRPNVSTTLRVNESPV